ncbi:DUF3040 domain-containing protein [Sanguibacter antarcticus]|uniref:DUF3040 family protein n=1 Tax=Sanguibacter antarcticus TaxID=372484 RepID=A0A2A9E3R9_9MICO|nr:DUF3040 domain-containing protein [Sanguibacter antarcticus]PFG33473.1 Protein of unknown function (DUF3040) [Sanguibacter antarcticus]
MPLSEYEQRVLEQMERELTSDDPRLATTLKSTTPRSSVRYVIAGIGLVVGLLALVIGAAQSLPWVGVSGFVVMFAAVAYAFAQPKETPSGPQGIVTEEGAVRKPVAGGQRRRASGHASKPSKSSGSFMQRLEERWERRSRGDDTDR